MKDIIIDISLLFDPEPEKDHRPTAKLASLPRYIRTAREMAGTGNRVTLTGPGPVWLYLIVAHELHGLCRELRYDSPATGPLMIFDHNPE